METTNSDIPNFTKATSFQQVLITQALKPDRLHKVLTDFSLAQLSETRNHRLPQNVLLTPFSRHFRVDRLIAVNAESLRIDQRERGTKNDNNVRWIRPVGRTEDVGQTLHPNELHRNGYGRRPKRTRDVARTMQTAAMGSAEKHTPVFGVPVDGFGKTVSVAGGRTRKVRGVADHGAERQNPTFVRHAVRESRIRSATRRQEEHETSV